MLWFRFVLILLTINFPYVIASSSSSANTTTTLTFYINNLIGQNSVTCQNRANPCKTLYYAWQKMFQINTTTTTDLEVYFSLTPSSDVYEPTNNDQASYSSLLFNCGRNRIKDIHIQAVGNVTMTARYKHDKKYPFILAINPIFPH